MSKLDMANERRDKTGIVPTSASRCGICRATDHMRPSPLADSKGHKKRQSPSARRGRWLPVFSDRQDPGPQGAPLGALPPGVTFVAPTAPSPAGALLAILESQQVPLLGPMSSSLMTHGAGWKQRTR